MKYLQQFLLFMEGKKSYCVAVIGAVYVLLEAFSVIDFTADQEKAIFGLLAVLFGVSLRNAIK